MLTRLLLQNTKITDAGLASLASLPELRELGLEGTAVTDAGMASVAKIARLRTLAVDGTKVTSAGIAGLRDPQTGAPTALEQLRLVDTAVDDAAVKTLSAMTSLKTLAVFHSRLSPDGAMAIRKALPTLSMDWPPPRPVAVRNVIRIKAGSTLPFRDSSGHLWQGELGFQGGSMTGHDASTTIDNTEDPGLYRSEHWAMASFHCGVPNGKYVAKLHFAETYDGITGEGQRVFSFNVQGRKFDDFDIWKKAGGKFKAYVETVPVEVTNGEFEIAFIKNLDNPAINAIELAPQEGFVPPPPVKPVAVQGVIRIKAGSSAPFTDSGGNVWQAELGFEGGNVAAYDENTAIANTKDPGLYRSEHWGMEVFSCGVPNGKYIARLHFAETFQGITGEGQRVFSFNVQGREFKNFDVWKKAGGPNRAYIETVPVEVTDGSFTITFTAIVENPQINAIELVPQEGSGPAGAARRVATP